MWPASLSTWEAGSEDKDAAQVEEGEAVTFLDALSLPENLLLYLRPHNRIVIAPIRHRGG
jgi:hypothetical protein